MTALAHRDDNNQLDLQEGESSPGELFVAAAIASAATKSSGRFHDSSLNTVRTNSFTAIRVAFAAASL
jgi:hypothetical protein